MEFFPFTEFNTIMNENVCFCCGLIMKNHSLFQFPISTDSDFVTKLLMDIVLEYSFPSSRALFRLQFFSAYLGEWFQTACIISTDDWVSMMFTPCLWNMNQHIYVLKGGLIFLKFPIFIIYANSSIQSTYKTIIVGNIYNVNSYKIICEGMEHK